MSLRPMAVVALHVSLGLLACAVTSLAQDQSAGPAALLAEAERLAWLRVWTRAEPLYAKAREEFATVGDKRNALYAEVSQLRGQLPRLAVADVSERLSAYLEDPEGCRKSGHPVEDSG